MSNKNIHYNFGLLSDEDVQLIGSYMQKEEKRATKAISNLKEQLTRYQSKVEQNPDSQVMRDLVKETQTAIEVQTARLDQIHRLLDLVVE